MILLNGFSRSAVGDVIKNDLDNFDVGVVNPGLSLLIHPNMWRDRGSQHGANLPGVDSAGKEVLEAADTFRAVPVSTSKNRLLHRAPVCIVMKKEVQKGRLRKSERLLKKQKSNTT